MISPRLAGNDVKTTFRASKMLLPAFKPVSFKNGQN